MKIHAMATPSDWFYFTGAYGDPGVGRMCDLFAEAGGSRIYLRTHDGGKANYPSRHGTTFVGSDVFPRTGGFASYPQSYFRYLKLLDFTKWSPFLFFAAHASDYGVEPGLWHTIMEDDHGGAHASDFVLSHPHLRCVKRNGEPINGALEFWFEEAREYKLKILDEVLELGTQRILLDLVRRNGLPSADVDGNYQYGFNPEILEAFRKEAGLDARKLTPGSDDWRSWVNFMSRPYTEFFLEVFRRAKRKGFTIDLLTWPVHLKTWMGIDLEKLLDSGSVEKIHVASHTYSYSKVELERQLSALRPQVGKRPVEIVPSISAYDGVARSGLDTFFEAMENAGVKTVVLHESQAMNVDRVSERFRALAFGVPHYKRVLRSRRHAALDWARADKFSGFLRGYNQASLETDQLTEIQVAHTNDALHVRVICHERNVKGLLPVSQWPADNYNVKVLGARTWWSPNDSVHLFLSPANQFNNYFHFVLDPSGKASQEQRLDELWNGDWSHEVKINDKDWTATFHLPFKSLEFQPSPGLKIAAHVVRSQANPLQVSSHTLANTGIVNPDEFGFWTFE